MNQPDDVYSQVTQRERTLTSASPDEQSFHVPRFRTCQTLAWTFSPGIPLTTSMTTGDRANASTRHLAVWVHKCHAELSDGSLLTTRHDDANCLHVVLNAESSLFAASTLLQVLAELREVVALLAETYSISSNQVYLAARGDCASLAFRLLLLQPETFCGIALFDPDLSAAVPVSIGLDDRLAHLRAMLVTSIDYSSTAVKAIAFGRLLHSAGLRITTHVYTPGRLSPQQMYRDLVKWITSKRFAVAT